MLKIKKITCLNKVSLKKITYLGKLQQLYLFMSKNTESWNILPACFQSFVLFKNIFDIILSNLAGFAYLVLINPNIEIMS